MGFHKTHKTQSRHWGGAREGEIRGSNSGEGEKRIGNKCEFVLRCSKVNAPHPPKYGESSWNSCKKTSCLPQAVLFRSPKGAARFSNCLDRQFAEGSHGRCRQWSGVRGQTRAPASRPTSTR